MDASAKLTEEKICQCLKSLNVPVCLNDLKTPSKEFIIRVFDTFLKDLQINFTNPILRPFEAIQHIENPEMCEDAQMLIILTVTMNEILRCISPLTVTVNDIVAPKPKRTKKILNYLIIFWNVYYKKYSLFLSVAENLKEEMQEAYDLKQENENLEEKIQEFLEKLGNMNPTKDELLTIASAKTKKMNELEKHREKVMEEHQHLKEKENGLRTQISNLDVDIVTLKEKINELDQLIISSPEKITADVQKIKEQVKEIDRKIQEKEIEKKERKKNYQSLLLVQEHVKSCTTKQHESYSKLQLLSETVQNLCLLETKCQEEKEHLKELLIAQEGKETLAEVYDRKAAKIQLMKNDKSTEIEETYRRIQGEVSDLKKDSEKLSQTITQVEKNIDKSADAVIEIVNKCQEAKAVADKMKAQYASKVGSITEDFHKNCDEVIEKAKNTCKFY